MAESNEEQPDVVVGIRLIPLLVPGVEGAGELAHMEAFSEGPAVLICTLSDAFERLLAALPVPGRIPWNNPTSAAATPPTTMRMARRKRSNFGMDLDLGCIV